MPSYKTHSIHGELVISRLNLTDKINYEAFKTFCIGPDLLMASSPSTFHMQHEHYTKEYLDRKSVV